MLTGVPRWPTQSALAVAAGPAEAVAGAGPVEAVALPVVFASMAVTEVVADHAVAAVARARRRSPRPRRS